MRRRFRLAIFDLDGTLVDSRADIARALNRALAQHGLPSRSEAEVTSMIGGGVGRLVQRAAPQAGDDTRAALAREFRAHYAAGLVLATRAYAGVERALEIAPEVHKAVLTNKPGTLARRLCAALGLTRWLEAVLGEDDLPRRKPDPAGVERLRARFGAARGETIYVGDSLVDLETARAADVPVALVTWGYADPATLRSARPDDLVETPEELCALVASRAGPRSPAESAI